MKLLLGSKFLSRATSYSGGEAGISQNGLTKLVVHGFLVVSSSTSFFLVPIYSFAGAKGT
jgi:hypothetical protein